MIFNINLIDFEFQNFLVSLIRSIFKVQIIFKNY